MGFLDQISFEVKRLVTLDTYRGKAFGTSDLLLPRLFVADGVIRNKDGSFTSCFRWHGPDLGDTPDENLNFLSDVILTDTN